MADIDLQLDMGPLNRAMHLAESWSESTPIFLAVRTAQRIVTKATEYTPAVSVGQIDSELDVAYFPGKTPKTGKLSKQSKNAIPLFGNEQDAGSERSLAFLIQLARMALVSRTLTPETVDAFADLCETIVVQREMLATIRRDGLMQTLLTGASVVSQAHPLIAKWTALKVRVEASKARFLLTGTGKPAVALEQPKDEWSEFETPLRAVK